MPAIQIANSSVFLTRKNGRQNLVYFNELFGNFVPLTPFFSNMMDGTAVTPNLPNFVGPILPVPKWNVFADGLVANKLAIFSGLGASVRKSPPGIAFGNSLVTTDSWAFPVVPPAMNVAKRYQTVGTFTIFQAFSSIGFCVRLFAEQGNGGFFTFEINLHADGFYLNVVNRSGVTVSSTFIGTGITGPILYDIPFEFKVVVINRIASVFVGGTFIVGGVFLGGANQLANVCGFGFHDTFSNPFPLQAMDCTRFLYYGYHQ